MVKEQKESEGTIKQCIMYSQCVRCGVSSDQWDEGI